MANRDGIETLFRALAAGLQVLGPLLLQRFCTLGSCDGISLVKVSRTGGVVLLYTVFGELVWFNYGTV